MSKRIHRLASGVLCLGLGLGTAACDDSESGSGTDAGTGSDAGSDAGATASVSWELTGLEPLGSDYVYEGWIIVDGAPVSTGRFNVDADGEPEQVLFELDVDQLEDASKFVLSIEPVKGDDPAPSATKLLAGDFEDGVAMLAIEDEAALGTDLLDAEGAYILETPTTGSIADDYDQGIWYLTMPGPKAGLDLAALPDGWTYEGWIVGDDGPVSTGRFASTDGEDSDGAGSDAGDDGAPPFPGQDFIDPALSLVGLTAVISVEPVPDNSPAPFVLKPLVHTIPDVAAGEAQEMENNAAATTPSGTATLLGG